MAGSTSVTMSSSSDSSFVAYQVVSRNEIKLVNPVTVKSFARNRSTSSPTDDTILTTTSSTSSMVSASYSSVSASFSTPNPSNFVLRCSPRIMRVFSLSE